MFLALVFFGFTYFVLRCGRSENLDSRSSVDDFVSGCGYPDHPFHVGGNDE